MKRTVKCAKLYGIGDLRYEEAPFPECGGDEVIVQVKSCGICGSDLGRVYVKGTYTFPTVIGHEFSQVGKRHEQQSHQHRVHQVAHGHFDRFTVLIHLPALLTPFPAPCGRGSRWA